MKLLFKRSQSQNAMNRAVFKLWAKIEFEDDEEEIVAHYRFAEALLIDTLQPGFLRMVGIVGIGSAILAYVFLVSVGISVAMVFAILAGVGAGWFYYDRKRESIYVRDLMHGRYFDCRSIVELVRKEAWLGIVTSFLRQVMESAKLWDGTEVQSIEALTQVEAKLVVIRGL